MPYVISKICPRQNVLPQNFPDFVSYRAVLSLINLIIGGIRFSYDLFMIAVTVIDVLLLAAMICSNPRMRSTIRIYGFYLGLLLLAVFGMTLRYGVTYVNKIMTTVAVLVFLISHIFSAIKHSFEINSACSADCMTA